MFREVVESSGIAQYCSCLQQWSVEHLLWTRAAIFGDFAHQRFRDSRISSCYGYLKLWFDFFSCSSTAFLCVTTSCSTAGAEILVKQGLKYTVLCFMQVADIATRYSCSYSHWYPLTSAPAPALRSSPHASSFQVYCCTVICRAMSNGEPSIALFVPWAISAELTDETRLLTSPLTTTTTAFMMMMMMMIEWAAD